MGRAGLSDDIGGAIASLLVGDNQWMTPNALKSQVVRTFRQNQLLSRFLCHNKYRFTFVWLPLIVNAEMSIG